MADKSELALHDAENEFLSELFKKNNLLVHATAHSALGEFYGYLADEVTDELWLLACVKGKELYTHSNPVRWLLLSTRYIASSMMRKYSKEISTHATDNIDDIPDNTDIHNEAFHNIENDNFIIESSLSNLSKGERRVFILIFREHMTTKEVAKMLNIAESTVRNIKKRATDKILDSIKKNF